MRSTPSTLQSAATSIHIQRRHTSRRVYGGTETSGVSPWADSTFGEAWSFNIQRRLIQVTDSGSVVALRELGFDRINTFNEPVTGSRRR